MARLRPPYGAAAHATGPVCSRATAATPDRDARPPDVACATLLVLRRFLLRAFARWWLTVVAPIAGCAHVGAVPLDRARTVRAGESVIVLRYAADDAADAERVEQALQTAAPLAVRWGLLPETLTITIHPTHGALESASRISGVDWMRAWARLDTIELQAPRTWTKGAATARNLAQLLAHELTHCVMYRAIGGERVALGLPAWFREGMATATAGQRFSTSMLPRDALTRSAAFSGEDAPLAYVVANEAFLALEGRYGLDRIRAIFAQVRSGTPFPQAFDDALGISLTAFETEFLGSLPPAAG